MPVAKTPRAPATYAAVGPPNRIPRRGMDKKCFRCGEWGHIQNECSAEAGATAGGGDGAGGQEAMMSMMAELIAEMRAARAAGSAGQPKK